MQESKYNVGDFVHYYEMVGEKKREYILLITKVEDCGVTYTTVGRVLQVREVDEEYFELVDGERYKVLDAEIYQVLHTIEKMGKQQAGIDIFVHAGTCQVLLCQNHEEFSRYRAIFDEAKRVPKFGIGDIIVYATQTNYNAIAVVTDVNKVYYRITILAHKDFKENYRACSIEDGPDIGSPYEQYSYKIANLGYLHTLKNELAKTIHQVSMKQMHLCFIEGRLRLGFWTDDNVFYYLLDDKLKELHTGKAIRLDYAYVDLYDKVQGLLKHNHPIQAEEKEEELVLELGDIISYSVKVNNMESIFLAVVTGVNKDEYNVNVIATSTVAVGAQFREWKKTADDRPDYFHRNSHVFKTVVKKLSFENLLTIAEAKGDEEYFVDCYDTGWTCKELVEYIELELSLKARKKEFSEEPATQEVEHTKGFSVQFPWTLGTTVYYKNSHRSIFIRTVKGYRVSNEAICEVILDCGTAVKYTSNKDLSDNIADIL
jgi:hypothetical protein